MKFFFYKKVSKNIVKTYFKDTTMPGLIALYFFFRKKNGQFKVSKYRSFGICMKPVYTIF